MKDGTRDVRAFALRVVAPRPCPPEEHFLITFTLLIIITRRKNTH